jgi:membrane associated rhomboid family serine protease
MARRVSYRGNGGFSLGPIGFLIVVNLMMYIATSIRSELFIDLFGLSRFYFPAHWWAIVTNLFIHAPFPQIWHIIANMLTLYFFGSYLIRLVGSRNFFIVYFLGGLLGNAVYLLLGPLYSIAIGASGAIFAVAGALTVLRPRLTVFIIPIPVPIPLFVAVLGGFLLLSFMPGVAWQAHLGGLVLGLVAGYIFRRRQRRSYWA